MTTTCSSSLITVKNTAHFDTIGIKKKGLTNSGLSFLSQVECLLDLVYVVQLLPGEEFHLYGLGRHVV